MKNMPLAQLNDLAEVARETRKLLGLHLELGLTHYPNREKLAHVFVTEPPPASAGAPVTVARGKVQKAGAVSGVSRESSAKQLEKITQHLISCTRCDAASGAVISGQGSPAPRLFVVGDGYEGGGDESGLLWGMEEDALFWKMMAAIGLDRESVYVTNCIKCPRKKPDVSPAGPGHACFSYLEQELLAIQPEVICVLGEVAAGLLLKKSAPLVRLRGRFHRYRYPHGGEAKIMATYHPRFLLQHPEMKPAVWLDLQAVQRKLPE